VYSVHWSRNAMWQARLTIEPMSACYLRPGGDMAATPLRALSFTRTQRHHILSHAIQEPLPANPAGAGRHHALLPSASASVMPPLAASTSSLPTTPPWSTDTSAATARSSVLLLRSLARSRALRGVLPRRAPGGPPAARARCQGRPRAGAHRRRQLPRPPLRILRPPRGRARHLPPRPGQVPRVLERRRRRAGREREPPRRARPVPGDAARDRAVPRRVHRAERARAPA
jgi:hypothetical protein